MYSKSLQKERKITILDVGGSSNYMEQQLNESGLDFDLTVIDILPKPNGLKAKYIKSGRYQNSVFRRSF